jgi:glycosyltransferase involved in cell wall biosynthesis
VSADAPAPTASFVVPLYCTGEGIPKLFAAFRPLTVPGGFELVLVNDGSRDDTLARAQALLADMPVPITLVDLARNYGEHAAVMEGFRQSRGKFIINLDDDLQNPVSEAVRLLERLQNSDDEVVYTYFDQKKHHWARNLGSRLTNAAATLMLDKPRDLYLSSFRGLRRELVDRLTDCRVPFPYIDGQILNATNKIGRLQVQHEARADGRSGYTLRKLVRLWMNMFFNFSVMPLRLASLLGVALCGLGAIFLLIVLAEEFVWGQSPSGWRSLMGAISIFSGAQLLILGLLGEYLGRSYLTLAGKPQSLVRSVTLHTPPADAKTIINSRSTPGSGSLER